MRNDTIADARDDAQRLEPIPPFGYGAMAAVERNAARLEAVQRGRVNEMARAVAAHLTTHPDHADAPADTPTLDHWFLGVLLGCHRDGDAARAVVAEVSRAP